MTNKILFGVVAGLLLARAANAQRSDAAPVKNAGELGALFWTLGAQCASEADDMYRRQCETIRAARADESADKTFVARGDALALEIGAPDDAGRQVPWIVRGCLACETPVVLDGASHHVVTVGEVSVRGGSLVGPVLQQGQQTFKDKSAAQRWLKEVAPRLRVDIGFRLPSTAQTWSRGSASGYSVALLGFRAYDPCTGTVIAAEPALERGPVDPSTCPVLPAVTDERKVAKKSKSAPMETHDNKLPRQLSPADVAATMQDVRKAAYACFTSYGVAGDALVRFTITKSGKVQKVKLSGAFVGTPTGDCVVKTVLEAEFDEFDGPDMNLSYPFQLR